MVGSGDGSAPRERQAREQLVSIECAHCAREVPYSGTGRRPRYCSPTCRSRAWELRRAAAWLDRPDPMPTVVREVVERIEARERRVPVPMAPRTAADWVTALEQLRHRILRDPLSVLKRREDLAELIAAVRAVDAALSGGRPQPPEPAPPTPTRRGDGGPRLTRQQRRALDRKQRKHR
ncbi:hypothetical protein L6E12_20955 [Actinokineospora sp. PR83]|uniref:hypothetical protein n=1 Tax=Actinokineospora sp. PR83 TaxID=2884908 RepID=UPI001F1D15BA|nr:hypothetical protein [Actinokineospora sp. PR83]MCG8918256.1 hypothetical protein [Actinokineospora sp. PR83]